MTPAECRMVWTPTATPCHYVSDLHCAICHLVIYSTMLMRVCSERRHPPPRHYRQHKNLTDARRPVPTAAATTVPANSSHAKRRHVLLKLSRSVHAARAVYSILLWTVGEQKQHRLVQEIYDRGVHLEHLFLGVRRPLVLTHECNGKRVIFFSRLARQVSRAVSSLHWRNVGRPCASLRDVSAAGGAVDETLLYNDARTQSCHGFQVLLESISCFNCTKAACAATDDDTCVADSRVHMIVVVDEDPINFMQL